MHDRKFYTVVGMEISSSGVVKHIHIFIHTHIHTYIDSYIYWFIHIHTYSYNNIVIYCKAYSHCQLLWNPTNLKACIERWGLTISWKLYTGYLMVLLVYIACLYIEEVINKVYLKHHLMRNIRLFTHWLETIIIRTSRKIDFSIWSNLEILKAY